MRTVGLQIHEKAEKKNTQQKKNTQHETAEEKNASAGKADEDKK